LREVQRGLNSMSAWCESWNIKINEDKTQAIYFSHQRRPPDSLHTCKGRNIPFVNSVKYLGVIFHKRMTWRLHIEKIESKVFRTFIRFYSVFKSERLSANIKLTPHKALIRSLMTYACPAWEFAAEIRLLKLLLQNKVLHAIDSFPRCTSLRDMHVAFQIRTFTITLQNRAGSKYKSYKIMKTKMFAILDKAKPDTGNTRGLNLAVVMFTTVEVFRLPLWRELLVSSRA
jgi:hypothetical protein